MKIEPARTFPFAKSLDKTQHNTPLHGTTVTAPVLIDLRKYIHESLKEYGAVLYLCKTLDPSFKDKQSKLPTIFVPVKCEQVLHVFHGVLPAEQNIRTA